MARIPDEQLERLKAEVSVGRLVEGSGIALKRSGKDWIGKCPFHEVDTASLSVEHALSDWSLGGLNTYAYVTGNPISFNDPEGLAPPPRPTGPIPSSNQMNLPGIPLPTGNQPMPRLDPRNNAVSNFGGRSEVGGNGADTFGAITGGGNAIRNPGFANAIESLIDPQRAISGESWIPKPRSGELCIPAPPGMYEA